MQYNSPKRIDTAKQSYNCDKAIDDRPTFSQSSKRKKKAKTAARKIKTIAAA